MDYWLGIDCGSVSVKGVIVDKDNSVANSCYVKNSGLIDTVKKVMRGLSTSKKIKGVGITGSGREFISLLVGGDIVESEIIAHYVAAMNFFPDVATIFDVGGEDSKLMVVNEGNLISFQMNRDCGGGTGAMIESIANRMDVPLEQIGPTALKSKTEVIIPSKCGIFAQSAVVSKLNKGVLAEDILMGVCAGLAGNYFTMLAKGQRLRAPYVFQGATAKNQALVKCFEKEVGGKIIVPEKPDLMGAIGAAILAKEELGGETRFKGFDNTESDFSTKTYYGTGCLNKCEITKIFKNQRLIGYIGNRCNRCLK